MSDFVNNFWSVYVAGITVAGILACLILLIITARKKVVSDSDNTTGHVWDEDLRELNNPMPRWWVWMFVITIVFGLLYLFAYPGLGSYGGQLQWSQNRAYEAEMAKANAQLEPLYARFTAMTPEEMVGDAQAMAIGERLFMNNCATARMHAAARASPIWWMATGCMAVHLRTSRKPLPTAASA